MGRPAKKSMLPPSSDGLDDSTRHDDDTDGSSVTTAPSKKRRKRRKALTEEEDAAILRAVLAIRPQHGAHGQGRRLWQQAADRVSLEVGGEISATLCKGRYDNLLKRFVHEQATGGLWPIDATRRELVIAALEDLKPLKERKTKSRESSMERGSGEARPPWIKDPATTRSTAAPSATTTTTTPLRTESSPSSASTTSRPTTTILKTIDGRKVIRQNVPKPLSTTSVGKSVPSTTSLSVPLAPRPLGTSSTTTTLPRATSSVSTTTPVAARPISKPQTVLSNVNAKSTTTPQRLVPSTSGNRSGGTPSRTYTSPWQAPPKDAPNVSRVTTSTVPSTVLKPVNTLARSSNPLGADMSKTMTPSPTPQNLPRKDTTATSSTTLVSRTVAPSIGRSHANEALTPAPSALGADSRTAATTTFRPAVVPPTTSVPVSRATISQSTMNALAAIRSTLTPVTTSSSSTSSTLASETKTSTPNTFQKVVRSPPLRITASPSFQAVPHGQRGPAEHTGSVSGTLTPRTDSVNVVQTSTSSSPASSSSTTRPSVLTPPHDTSVPGILRVRTPIGSSTPSNRPTMTSTPPTSSSVRLQTSSQTTTSVSSQPALHGGASPASERPISSTNESTSLIRQQTDELLREVAASRQERLKLKQQIESLNLTLEASRQEHAQLNDQVALLVAMVEESQQERAELKRDVASLSSMLKDVPGHTVMLRDLDGAQRRHAEELRRYQLDEEARRRVAQIDDRARFAALEQRIDQLEHNDPDELPNELTSGDRDVGSTEARGHPHVSTNATSQNVQAGKRNRVFNPFTELQATLMKQQELIELYEQAQAVQDSHSRTELELAELHTAIEVERSQRKREYVTLLDNIRRIVGHGDSNESDE